MDGMHVTIIGSDDRANKGTHLFCLHPGPVVFDLFGKSKFWLRCSNGSNCLPAYLLTSYIFERNHECIEDADNLKRFLTHHFGLLISFTMCGMFHLKVDISSLVSLEMKWDLWWQSWSRGECEMSCKIVKKGVLWGLKSRQNNILQV